MDELPDGTKIKRPTPLNLVPSDDDEGVPTSVLITASDAESEESDLVVDDEIRSLTQVFLLFSNFMYNVHQLKCEAWYKSSLVF